MAFTMEPTIILNNGGYPVAPLTTPEMVRFNDGAKLTEYIQNTNLLDNSYFVRPVNQRGAMTKDNSGGGSLYFIDRWYVMGAPQISNSGTATIVSDGIRLNPGTSLTQELEYPIQGDTTCSIGIVSGNATAIYYETGNANRFQIDNQSSTDPCVISWAKLERGRVATPYVYKGYGVEMLECMRYCVEIPRNAGFLGGVSSNSSIAYGIFNLSIPMRISPSIERNANSIWVRTTTGSRSGTGAHTIYELKPNCVILTVPFSGTAQVDSPAECFAETSMILSADL